MSYRRISRYTLASIINLRPGFEVLGITEHQGVITLHVSEPETGAREIFNFALMQPNETYDPANLKFIGLVTTHSQPWYVFQVL